MNALVMTGVGRIGVETVPAYAASENDVLVRVDSCGICGSDLRIIRFGSARIRYPHILGHEIAGTVDSVGASYRGGLSPGDRVSLSADVPCGRCHWCKTGLHNNCADNMAFGYEYPGGFAEYVLLDRRILEHGPVVKVPAACHSTQDELALSEPLACCINCLQSCGMREGKSVIIFGAGPMGCLLAKLARELGGSSVCVCEVDEERLRLSALCGADMYVKPEPAQLDEAVDKLTGGLGFDIAVVACPSVDAQELSLRCVRNRGIINLFGGLPPNSRLMGLDSNLVHYKEISVSGSHGSTPAHHRAAVDMIIRGRVDVKPIITAAIPMSELPSSLESLTRDRRHLKVVVNP